MRFRPGRAARRGQPFGRPANPFQAAALQSLEQANQLLIEGRPGQAAAIFTQLAETVEGRGNLRRAAHLQMQAARALVLVPDGEGAVQHAQKGLQLFLAAGLTGQASLGYGRIVAALRGRGLTTEADQLQRAMAPTLGAPAAATAPTPASVRLPAQCPQCSGPIRPDEVEWMQASSAAGQPAAECPYCGSAIYPE
jgi:hypothetical protein